MTRGNCLNDDSTLHRQIKMHQSFYKNWGLSGYQFKRCQGRFGHYVHQRMGGGHMPRLYWLEMAPVDPPYRHVIVWLGSCDGRLWSPDVNLAGDANSTVTIEWRVFFSSFPRRVLATPEEDRIRDLLKLNY